MADTHPLLTGLNAIAEGCRRLKSYDGLFERMYQQIRLNWTERQDVRWPSDKNWVLRTARAFTFSSTSRLEKQLQKEIAIAFEGHGWFNDLTVASGLVTRGGRQMNVDLVHQDGGSFEFIELKVASDDYFDAAMQILRYGAIYLLYRLEPDLASRYLGNEILTAKKVVLEVLAPADYYNAKEVDLATLEQALTAELRTFTISRQLDLDLSFRFVAFPSHFQYRPGIDPEALRVAVVNRHSPITRHIKISGHLGVQVLSFEDWESFGMPPERMAKQWKTGRSACELARTWTSCGKPQAPRTLVETLNSNCETAGFEIISASIEHETVLPFSTRGPRCHDLLLHAKKGARTMIISVEAKADESFGGKVFEELRKARLRPQTSFPRRLQWLTRSILGIDAFTDNSLTTLTEGVSELPYQLLSGIAGLMIEAQDHRCTQAVLIIHEFRTHLTVDSKLAANGAALADFLLLLWSANGVLGVPQLADKALLGPVSLSHWNSSSQTLVPGLFVGKFRTDLFQ